MSTEPLALIKPEVVQARDLVCAEDYMPLMTVQQAVGRKGMMNDFIANVLKDGEDYGQIPGGNKKKVLLKPGAEKLCSIFGLAPRYVKETVIEDWTGSEHGGEPLFYYEYRCQLYRGDRFMGEGIGSCNSWEAKYRWRQGSRKCPACGGEFIIKGKAEYGGGWLCFAKKGGCGAKFADGDKAIEGQDVGRVPNADVADIINTCQKMAQKRAQVAAVLTVTNCSDAFTQDLEEEMATAGIDTGGHPVGTQAAQDSVRDRRITETRAAAQKPASTVASVAAEAAALSEDVPKPLQAIFAGLARAGAVKQAFELLKAELLSAMPEYGEAEYKRLLEKHQIKPGSGNRMNAVKAVLLDIYQLAAFAKMQKQKQEQPYQASDEDLPTGLFGENESQEAIYGTD